jgi:predicted O-methyltransferase YrrM
MDMSVRDLNKNLKIIAADFGLNAAALVRYAKEDTRKGNAEGNPYGTSYGIEGKLLYALVRELKPKRILEIGTHHGGGANHLAAACLKNGFGEVVTVDINPAAGQHIEDAHKEIVAVVHENIDYYLPTISEPFDFIFEDGEHAEGQVHNIYNHLPTILNPGGYIISHDIAMDGVGDFIRNGMRKGGVNLEDVKVYVTAPSPCGMGIYKGRE